MPRRRFATALDHTVPILDDPKTKVILHSTGGMRCEEGKESQTPQDSAMDEIGVWRGSDTNSKANEGVEM